MFTASIVERSPQHNWQVPFTSTVARKNDRMVFGRNASVLEKQKGTPSALIPIMVARQASILIVLT